MRQLKMTARFTNRDTIALDRYFKELSKEQVLDKASELDLASRVQKGDMQAMEKLVKANLRFVITIAKQYEGLGLALDDLISEGNIGLLKAAKRFEPEKGFKFISYAVFWIRQSILKALNEHARLVRLPNNQLQQLQKLQQVFQKMEQVFSHDPDISEVATGTGMDAKEAAELIKFNLNPISTDTPLGEDGDATIGSLLEGNENTHPDNPLMEDSFKSEIERCLSHLNLREQEVIRLYFGLDSIAPMMVQEIAERLGLGRERVRQIKVQSVQKLRRLARSRSLQVYL